MVRVRQQLVTARSRTYAGKNPARSVTVHETGNTSRGADAAAHANLQSNENVRQASWHWQVDDKEAVQSFPHDVRCWHAGDGKKAGGGNYTSVAVEICVNEDGDYDKAVANAAELIRDVILPDIGSSLVKKHEDWSGKNCPSRLREGDQWAAFLGLITGKKQQPKEEKVVAGMVSPVQGYVSSEYGMRGGVLHGGIDIAGGGRSRPVYASFSGTLSNIVRGRKHGQSARIGKTVAPLRSGDGGRVRNPDGEQQVYIHVRFLSKWRNGDRVKAGQLLGYTNLSGRTSGYHLHYEEWTKAGKTRNPRVSFRHFGIEVGSKPKGTSTGGGSGSSGVEWPKNKLRVDGKFGPVSRRAYQRLLAPKSVGNYTGRIDGNFGPMTVRAEQRWLKSRGYYKGTIYGKRQVSTKKALQSLLRDRGFYKGRIDGKLGSMSNKALQRFLNDQRKYYT